MSDQTPTLDDLIRETVATELDGRMCSGWLLIAVGVNGDQVGAGGASYHYETMQGQPYHASVGLAHLLLGWLNTDDTEDDE